MRSIGRTITTMLVAVAALAVVASASASAATPEFNPVPAKKKFTDSSGAMKTTYGGGEWSYECTKGSATGEVTSGRALGKLVVTWTGCQGTNNGGATSCAVNSTGAKSGEIITEPLAAELGTVSSTEAPSGVGLRLKPESGKTWFTLTKKSGCVGEETVQGAATGEVAQVAKKQTTNELSFKLTKGHQAIKEITLDSGELEKPVLSLNSSTGTLEWNAGLTFEEALEVT
jgi:hypothetical protein